jgi:general secretion pathway protein M
LIELVRDRMSVFGLAVLAAVLLAAAIGLNVLSSERKEVEKLRKQHVEMLSIKDEYSSLSRVVQAREARKNLSNAQGIAQAVEEVFVPVGLKDRLKSIKSTGRRETNDGYEEEADISIEKLSMNEMVNIFYRIENAPMVLTLKKVAIKKSFENPELMNISLLVSFLKPK